MNQEDVIRDFFEGVGWTVNRRVGNRVRIKRGGSYIDLDLDGGSLFKIWWLGPKKQLSDDGWARRWNLERFDLCDPDVFNKLKSILIGIGNGTA